MSKLISEDITDAMEALGFQLIPEDDQLVFMNEHLYSNYVLYKAQTFETWEYDDQDQRFKRTIHIELNTFPNLSEWLMMLHIGNIITLKGVMNLIKANEQAESSIMDDATEMHKYANALKQIFS